MPGEHCLQARGVRRPGRTKLSREKPILPGRKQVFRQDTDRTAAGDVIARADEHLEGRPLLQMVMRAGRRMPSTGANLDAIQRYAAEELARLPAHVTALAAAEPPYPVRHSPALEGYHAKVRAIAGAP